MQNRTDVKPPVPFRAVERIYNPGSPHHSDLEMFNALTEAATQLCARDYRRVRDLIETYVMSNLWKAIENRRKEQDADPQTSRRQYTLEQIDQWKREIDAIAVIGARIHLTLV